MNATTGRTRVARLFIQLLCFAMCWAAGVAYGEQPGVADSGRARRAVSTVGGLSLKLDSTPLRLGLSGDPQDCDDEGDLALPGMHSSKVALYVPTATAISGRERVTEAAHRTEKVNDAGAAPRLASSSEEKPVRTAASEKPVSAASQWEIVSADKTLNAALARWASIAGWQLVWELPVDYAVEARTVVPGTFEEAVGVVAKSMDSAEIPMKAIFYAGNRVLRIVPKGVE